MAALATSMALWMATASAAPDGLPRLYLEDFRLGNAPEAERVPGWRRLDAERADADALSGCRALGFDCSDDPDPERAAERFLKPEIVAGPYRGTARIALQRGASYYAKFDAPPGFSICRAGIDLVDGFISRGAVFAGSIQRNGRDGLGVYAALPEPGGGGIAFRLLIATVPEARFDREACWPDGTIVFLCAGRDRCRPSRAYPETDLR
ncbi:hypothetical protein [Kaistia sp. 32K]|uniref:hypothetical protein n=1 Tax=Kaistia sp. 32K TaxID=2795690 RepID=UPI00191554E8|nr:hypothetical protein [Kaistia sp. 32K]